MSMALSPLISLAFRNVSRNRSRSALTLGAIFFGVALTIMLSAFGNGLMTLMVDDVVNGKLGAIQIHRAGYADLKDNQPLKLDLPEGGELEAKVRSVRGVDGVAPRLVFGGLVNNGKEATMFIGRGVHPVKEYEAVPWAGKEVVGTAITAGAKTGGVVGGELARALGAAPGATLILQAQTQRGQQNALDLDVGGTLDNTNVFESKRSISVPLAWAQELLRMPGRATELAVRVDQREAVDRVAADLRTALGPGYEVETWRQLQPNLADVVTFQKVIIGIISLVFLIIVVFGVINTMVMSVMERTREIGTMMAVGVRRGRISVLFLMEAAILALIGGGLGAAAARGVVALIKLRGGFKMAPPGSTVERFHLVPIIPPGIVSTAVVAATAGAVLAALYPAWKAARLRPVEALRAL